jgi:hypothetical protein
MVQGYGTVTTCLEHNTCLAETDSLLGGLVPFSLKEFVEAEIFLDEGFCCGDDAAWITGIYLGFDAIHMVGLRKVQV